VGPRAGLDSLSVIHRKIQQKTQSSNPTRFLQGIFHKFIFLTIFFSCESVPIMTELQAGRQKSRVSISGGMQDISTPKRSDGYRVSTSF